MMLLMMMKIQWSKRRSHESSLRENKNKIIIQDLDVDFFDGCSQGMSWTGLPLLIIIIRDSCVWSWSLSSWWTITTENLLHELLVDEEDRHLLLVFFSFSLPVKDKKQQHCCMSLTNNQPAHRFDIVFIYVILYLSLSSHRQRNKSGWLKKSR